MSEASRLIALDIDPITISYQGMDAESGGIDMALLAKSLDGYARILATVSSFAVTFVYQKHVDAMPVRVRVQETRKGSFEILVVLDFVRQAVFDPDLREFMKAILDYILKSIPRKEPEKESEMKDVVMKFFEQQGKDSEQKWELIHKMTDRLIPAARNAASPIGETCERTTLSLGQDAITVWDETDKAAIGEKVKPAVQPMQTYTIYISELDLETGGAKITFGQDDQQRFKARISDPLLSEAENPYARALASRSSINVQAKAEILDGEICGLFISDVEV